MASIPAAYGPNGEPFRIIARGDRVHIDAIAAPADARMLKSLLREFVATVNVVPGSHESLAELLARCEPYVEG